MTVYIEVPLMQVEKQLTNYNCIFFYLGGVQDNDQ